MISRACGNPGISHQSWQWCYSLGQEKCASGFKIGLVCWKTFYFAINFLLVFFTCFLENCAGYPGDKNFSILHLSCRTSDLQPVLALVDVLGVFTSGIGFCTPKIRRSDVL